MSDIAGAVEAPPVEAAPVESGQGEVTETPTPAYFDPEGVGDHLVKLKVGGEELEVPVREALSGYQRQADYTRKTQELAARQQELQAAEILFQQLKQDPEGTLAVLQQRLAQPEQVADDPYEGDPYAREMAEMRSALDEIKIERTLGRLQAKYGEFDPRAVVATAMELRTDNLEYAYKVYDWERQQMTQAARTEAEQEAARVAAERDAAINAAKAQVGQAVSGGSSTLGGGAPVPTEGLTLREQIAAAVRLHS